MCPSYDWIDEKGADPEDKFADHLPISIMLEMEETQRAWVH